MTACAPIPNQPSVRILAAIFLLGVVVRLSVMYATRPFQQPMHVEIQHVALSIVNGHGFGNPYPVATGPTALFTPGCPLILAAIYRVFGTGEIAEAVTYCLNSVMASAAFALMPLLSWLLGFPRRVGIAAAVAGAAFPVYLLNEFRSTQAVAGALWLVTLCILSAWAWKTGKMFSGGTSLAVGAVWGFALLFAPNLLLIGLLWLGIALCYFGAGALKFAAVALTAMLTVLSPWVVRNQLVLGSPILTRSNLGLELWIANNDVSGASYLSNETSHQRYQPFVNLSEAAQLARVGEAAYMHQKMEEAGQWIELHPGRFSSLTTMRVVQFWFPVTYRTSQTLVLRVLTIAGVLGVFFAWRRNRTAFWLVGSIWFAYPLIYYIVQLDNPYRYPMYWSLLLMAVYGVGCLIEMAERKGLGWHMAVSPGPRAAASRK